MKALKLSLVIMASALVTIGLSGMAYAFHEGGVATCDGCHTMHNSVGNAVASKNGHSGKAIQFTGNQSLLIGSDPGSTCLNCHASGGTTKASSYHVYSSGATASAPPANYTPGGDFAWVAIQFNAATDLHTTTVVKDRQGHNIIASDFGLFKDGLFVNSPGGGTTPYSASYLSCISCHDPHPSARMDASGNITLRGTGPIIASGSYGPPTTALSGTDKIGVYRLLGGIGYIPVSVLNAAGGTAFSTNPPVAVAPSSYNRGETSGDTRVAYGSGMSEWCQNCHSQMHNDSLTSNLIHPASNAAQLGSTIAGNYNKYVKSGDLSGGTGATAYTSLVPFEEGTGVSLATLTSHAGAPGSTAGPSSGGTENVMCLTCHRAHASAFDHMTRWDNDFEFITENSLYPVSATANSLYATGGVAYTAGMYGRSPSIYATYQRSLCNKCHVKD